MASSLQATLRLLAGMFPYSGVFALAHLLIRRLIGRPTALDRAIQDLLAAVRAELRRAITEIMMTISLPSGVGLRLGADLKADFPASLQQITSSELRSLLERLDPTPDSPIDSGALDWADLPERLHYICDLFRLYQENQELFSPPYTAEQVEAIKAGRRPEGRL